VRGMHGVVRACEGGRREVGKRGGGVGVQAGWN
jgi:hypothetical protein